MVGPARKREAVVHLEGKFQVSQRRACKSLAQPCSTQRYVSRQSGKDAVLVVDLRRFASKHPRAGYRMAHKHLRREGGKANLKRVQRLLRQEGLRVPRRQAVNESFNSRMRDELLNVESFGSRIEAKVLGKVLRDKYNHLRLHSSLDYRTPGEFAQQCHQASCARLRQPDSIAGS